MNVQHGLWLFVVSVSNHHALDNKYYCSIKKCSALLYSTVRAPSRVCVHDMFARTITLEYIVLRIVLYELPKVVNGLFKRLTRDHSDLSSPLPSSGPHTP